MAKEKTTGLYSCIAIIVVIIIAVVIGVVVANNNKAGDTSDNGDSSSGGSTAQNYSTVDVSIEYGDYDGMAKLSKGIQNGEATGKTVKIEGTVSHPMSSYSVVQENESGNQKIGTRFIIDGASDDDYPEDGDHIVITGTVTELEPLVFIIQTTKNHVEVK